MNAFIIGAGFTKAVVPHSPLNDDLLKELAGKKPDSAARALGEMYDENRIEVALTKFDCDNPCATGLRQKIEEEIGEYFSSPSFLASKELLDEKLWLASFIDQAFAQDDVAISLNYDCLLEGALDCAGKWTPNGGYGSYLNHPILHENFSESPVTILKIHGSASFRSPTYRNKPGSIEFVIKEHFFPRSGETFNFSWSGDERPYLIAPSYVKIPKVEIAHLMLEALTESAKADNLVIIGSALRKEDSFLTLITTSFLPDLRWNKKRIIIVDPAAESIGQRLEDYWDVNLSDQIVPVKAYLQDSVTELAELIRKR